MENLKEKTVIIEFEDGRLPKSLERINLESVEGLSNMGQHSVVTPQPTQP